MILDALLEVGYNLLDKVIFDHMNSDSRLNLTMTFSSGFGPGFHPSAGYTSSPTTETTRN